MAYRVHWWNRVKVIDRGKDKLGLVTLVPYSQALRGTSSASFSLKNGTRAVREMNNRYQGRIFCWLQYEEGVPTLPPKEAKNVKIGKPALKAPYLAPKSR